MITRPKPCLPILLIAVAMAGAPASAAAPAPIDVAGRKQLFIDHRFIESQQNISLRIHPPEKKEIVLRAAEGENGHQFMLSTVLDVDGEYYMYYMTFRSELRPERKGFNCHVTRLAKSTDGLHWQRVRAGVIDIGNGLDNNIVMTGCFGTFFLDPNATDGCRFWWIGNVSERPEWPETTGALYRSGDAREGGVYLCKSTDGIRWTRIKDPILPFGCDTRNQAFYDTRIGKYVAYLRSRPFDQTRRAVSRAVSPTLVAPWPFHADPDRETGPHGLYSGLERELPVVMDATDHPHAISGGIYSPNVHQYPWADDVYVAFPEVYRLREKGAGHGRDERGLPGNEGPLDVALAVSRDGVQWRRFAEPYVGLGRIGQPDGGTVYMGVGMVRQGDELWQYTTASPHTHHGFFLTLPGKDGGIQRVVQRLDGFVAAYADLDGGALTTPLLAFAGSRLHLNVDCGALGEVWVELRDADGLPIPGFTMDEAVSVDRNGVDQEVWWASGPDLGPLARKPIRLHIRMRAAKLYAFQFVEAPPP
jgi:hypothetical protein